MTMRLIAWNMNARSSNWTVLAELMQSYGANASMVQEAVAPPHGFKSALAVMTDPSLGDQGWQTPVPSGANRKFASAVAAIDQAPIEMWRPVPLATAAYKDAAISHPGQWVAAAFGAHEKPIWVVSLYGLWDTLPHTKDIYAEASLHRALSDLSRLFYSRSAERIVLAGDLNVWRGYGDRKWQPGYQSVFDRLVAYGFELAGPLRSGGLPLDKCPCPNSGKPECRHVRTYRHQRSEAATPYQTDFAFVRGIRLVQCRALDEERHWQHSDHCPLLIEVEER